MIFTTGTAVVVRHEQHGHLASAKAPTFRGVVEYVSGEYTNSLGKTYHNVVVRLAPSMKTTRVFRTDRDAFVAEATR